MLPLYLLPFTSYVVPCRRLSNPIELGLVLLVRPLSVFLSKATTDFHFFLNSNRVLFPLVFAPRVATLSVLGISFAISTTVFGLACTWLAPAFREIAVPVCGTSLFLSLFCGPCFVVVTAYTQLWRQKVLR
jgi:hypothetical protein